MIEDLERVARSGRPLGKLLSAFFSRKASRLKEVSEQESHSALPAILVALIMGCVIFVAVLLGLPTVSGWTGLLGFIAKTVFLSALGYVPIVGVIALTQGRVPFYTLFNLLLIQQLGIASIVLLGIVIAGSTPRAQSDFQLFFRGDGQATPIHQQICGRLARRALITAENSQLSRRNAALSRELMASVAQDRAHPPRTPDEALDRAEYALGLHAKALENTREHVEAFKRIERVTADDEAASAAYRKAYPMIPWAFGGAVVCLLLLAGITSLHVWQLCVYHTPRKRKLAAASGLLASWLLVAAVWQFASADGFFQVTRPIDTLMASEVSRLRNDFATNAPFCPNIDRQGLW